MVLLLIVCGATSRPIDNVVIVVTFTSNSTCIPPWPSLTTVSVVSPDPPLHRVLYRDICEFQVV